MATQHNGTENGSKTAIRDHATHPEAGSGMREDKSFAKDGKGKGAPPDSEPEIAADDAGASAMAEKAQKEADAEAEEQPQ